MHGSSSIRHRVRSSILGALKSRRNSRRGESSGWNGMETLEQRVMMTATPVISEFMADNTFTLVDQDGEFSDWIEVYNPTPDPVNLAGWHLTDDALDLTKWTFPSVTIPASGYLVVFASSKDIAIPGSEMHTNFRLSKEGEYLALVQPDGLTVAHDFAPTYPPQLSNVSYGLPQGAETIQLISPGAPVKLTVPADGSLGTGWTATGFVDSGWTSGTTGVGYEVELTSVPELYRDDFDNGTIAVGDGWTIDIPVGGTSTVSETGGNLRIVTPGSQNTSATRGLAPFVYRNAPDGSDYSIITKMTTSPLTGTSLAGVQVYDAADGLFGLALMRLNNGSLILSVGSTSIAGLTQPPGGTTSTPAYLRLDRVTSGTTVQWKAYGKYSEGAAWTLVRTVTEGIEIPAIVNPKPGVLTRTTTASSSVTANFEYFEVNEVATAPPPSIYGPLITTDIQTQMFEQNSSNYMRIPFEVTGDPSEFTNLTLGGQYDDGYVAYLNGTEVARKNAPGSLSWNSAATAQHETTVPPQPYSTTANFDALTSPYTLNSFGAAPAPTVLAGGPTGSYLRLISTVNSLTNSLNFTFDPRQTTGAGSASIIADFDYRAFGGASPADGFFFGLISRSRYGSSGPGAHGVVPGVVAEEPNFSDVLAIGFDVYPSVNDVSLHWDASELKNTAIAPGTFDIDSNVFNHVRVEVTPVTGGAQVTVRLTPNSLGVPGPTLTVYDHEFVPGFDLDLYRIEFGGRTGGLNMNVDLDNIVVQHIPIDDGSSFESVDLSAHIGLLQTGTNVLAVHGLNLSAGDDDFVFLPKLVGTKIEELGTVNNYFVAPSPGSANPNGLLGQVGAPELSVASGAFTSGFNVTITPPAGSPEIRYTLDGKEPTETSTLYTGPITISTTRQLRVKAFEAGHLSSETVTGNYLFIASNVLSVSSNLPLVVIDTFGATIGEGTNVASFATFIDTDGTGRSHIIDAPQYAGPGGIKIRGSSSTQFPKKSYGFETWNGNGQDESVPLLGMPSESDWVLYAPYTDKTLMRDVLAYLWSNQAGDYAPRTKFVEVYVNQDGGAVSSADYVGVYVLIERIKRDDNRVDIDKLEPDENSGEDVTGGYIFKRDRLDPGDAGFGTAQYPGGPFAFVEPKESEITTAQRAYLTSYVQGFETALNGPNFASPTLGYEAWIDVDSFINHHIFTEMAKNIDGYRLSTFYYKDKNGKLSIGPLWDFNLSLGNANYLTGENPAGWYYTGVGGADYPWWNRLFQDPNFVQRYTDRWAELREETFIASEMLAQIDEYAALLTESAARNYARWPILGTYIWPNPVWPATYGEEITNMKNWLSSRLTWMDTQFVPAPIISEPGGEILPGLDVSLAATRGTIYYTTDGTDPRLSGGGINPEALSFSGGSATQTVVSGSGPIKAFVPTNDTLGTTWTQTNFNTAGWLSGNGGVGYDREATYIPYIGVDVRTQMDGINGSVYSRHEFNLTDAGSVSSLTLRLQYDDGFLAYINGTLVASVNAPVGATWNSVATALHDDAAAVIFQDFVINPSLYPNLLNNGLNVLAIHGLNQAIASSDMLIRAELLTSSASGSSLTINQNTNIFARAKDGSTWSAPASELYVVDLTPGLAISEINYNPQDPTPAEILAGFLDNDDFEFIEIHNIGGSPISLEGYSFSQGISLAFGVGAPTLAPGAYAVAVRNLAAFQMRYGSSGITIAGIYTGFLDNSGEQVTLLGPVGEIISQVSYGDGGDWPNRPDGSGSSLELANDAAIPPGMIARGDFMGDPDNWRSSVDYAGSPGRAGTEPGSFGVVVNEVLSASVLPQVDYIELYNQTGGVIDISGWYLSDSNGNYTKYQIPASTMLGAHGYAVFDESHFNPTPLTPGPNHFALSGTYGEQVWLLKGDGTKPTHFVDKVDFGSAELGVSFGRLPNGSGPITPNAQRTDGAVNTGAVFGPVVIGEVMYRHPSDLEQLEFIELYNPTNAPISLDGWQITDAANYVFGSDVTIGAGQTLVILPFDPNDPLAAAQKAAFEAAYGVTLGVNAVGPFLGNLSDQGEKLSLLRPGTPPLDDPGFVPMYVSYEVYWGIAAPWPTEAAGGGDSLNLVMPDLFGNFGWNWQPLAPTPGDYTLNLLGDVDRDGDIDAADIDMLHAQLNPLGASPFFDLNRDGDITRADVDKLVQEILDTYYGDATLDGQVSIGDLTILAENFGGGGGWAQGDFNGDGQVSIGDLTLLAENFGQGAALTGDSDGAAPAGLQAIGDGAAGGGEQTGPTWDHIDSALEDEEDGDMVDILGELAG